LPRVKANGIEIAYETFGDGEPLMLIMGIGAPMLYWRDSFCERLSWRGFRVIRLDNRDAGRSTRLQHLGVPDVYRGLARRTLGLPVEAPYSLDDMADDVVGLLDALGLDAAHVVGTSMGGMIAQTLAIRHPARLRSMTSIMSTTGRRRDVVGQPGAMLALFEKPPTNREAAIEQNVRLLKRIGSPAFPAPESELRDLVARSVDRGMFPDGFARQMGAILASGSRHQALRQVTVPTMVLHGSDDPLIPLRGGRATAQAVPGARFAVIEGMGHDMPRPTWPQLLDRIEEIACA